MSGQICPPWKNLIRQQLHGIGSQKNNESQDSEKKLKFNNGSTVFSRRVKRENERLEPLNFELLKYINFLNFVF